MFGLTVESSYFRIFLKARKLETPIWSLPSTVWTERSRILTCMLALLELFKLAPPLLTWLGLPLIRGCLGDRATRTKALPLRVKQKGRATKPWFPVYTHTHTSSNVYSPPHSPKGCFPKASVSATWHFKKQLHVQGLIHVLTEQEVMAWMGSNLSAAARLARGYYRCSTFSSSQ